MWRLSDSRTYIYISDAILRQASRMSSRTAATPPYTMELVFAHEFGRSSPLPVPLGRCWCFFKSWLSSKNKIKMLQDDASHLMTQAGKKTETGTHDPMLHTRDARERAAMPGPFLGSKHTALPGLSHAIGNFKPKDVHLQMNRLASLTRREMCRAMSDSIK